MTQIASVWSPATSATKKVVPFTGAEKAKFIAFDGVKDDYYGFAVGVSYDGAIIAIGAYLDDDKGSASGSVYVYRRTGTTWYHHSKLVAADGISNDYYGYHLAVSGDGNRIVVGAYQDDDGGTNSGTARVYSLVNDVWVLEGKFVGLSTQTGDYFSRAVDINHLGTRVVIGAYADDNKGTDSGSIFIFKRVGTTWIEEAVLTASDGEANDYFGRAVAISGDGLTAIAGAYYEDTKGSNSGSCYVYRFDGSSWIQHAKLVDPAGAANDYFGWSVDLSYDGKTAIIGSYLDDDKASNAGSVSIFTETNGTWSREIKLVPSDGASTDYFGYCVSISNNGKSVAISSHLDDDVGSASGSVYFYNKINGVWTFFKKLRASDGAASDYFGFSVGLSGNGKVVIAGAYQDDDKGSASGSAYVYE